MDRSALERAGFNEDQIDALVETFSPLGHRHDIDDVEDLAEELAALEPDNEDDDEEEP